VDKVYCTLALVLVFLCSYGANTVKATEFIDPMRPLNYQVPTTDTNPKTETEELNTATWKLTAVLLSEQRSVAVINGQSFQPGDELEGYTLSSIYEDRVVLTGKGRKLVLQRSGTGLKKNPSQENRK
jgi:type II secretory pathway component PulC